MRWESMDLDESERVHGWWRGNIPWSGFKWDRARMEVRCTF